MLEPNLFAFMERTADAAFAVTREGEICSWDHAAERLFGYSSADVLNRICHEVLDGHGGIGTQVCTEAAVFSNALRRTWKLPILTSRSRHAPAKGSG